MAEPRESALSQLKYPLVFFGLGLIVVETAFGAGLAASADSVTLVIVLSSWMGGLFLVSILVVAFLVYKVPTHVMLESQKDLKRERKEIDALRDRLSRAALVLEKAQGIAENDSNNLVGILKQVRLELYRESGRD